jgi:hypothetical protein
MFLGTINSPKPRNSRIALKNTAKEKKYTNLPTSRGHEEFRELACHKRTGCYLELRWKLVNGEAVDRPDSPARGAVSSKEELLREVRRFDAAAAAARFWSRTLFLRKSLRISEMTTIWYPIFPLSSKRPPSSHSHCPFALPRSLVLVTKILRIRLSLSLSCAGRFRTTLTSSRVKRFVVRTPSWDTWTIDATCMDRWPKKTVRQVSPRLWRKT